MGQELAFFLTSEKNFTIELFQGGKEDTGILLPEVKEL